MCSKLRCSIGSGSTQTGGLVLACWLTLVCMTVFGCGRIPGLYDAALPVRANSGGNLAIADAARDARRTADVAVGSGGTAAHPGTGGAGGIGGKGGTSGSTTSCSAIVNSEATRQPSDVLLVVDRSGSMSYNIAEPCTCDPTGNPRVVCANTTDCTTRWASLVSAIDGVLASTPYLNWGLKLFSTPNAGACAVTSGVEIPVGGDTAAAIQARLASTTYAGETPTAAAITEATAYLKSQSDSNSKVILLATDGEPNCGGSPPSVYETDVPGTTDAIAAAFKAGFLVYVIGLGTSVGNLDAFAQAGGTGRYYAALSPDDIARALSSISAAATCTFTLAALPPDQNDMAVYLDKYIVPRDASNGWSFGASAQTILLHGSYCDQALAETTAAIQVLFACGQPLPSFLP